MVRHSKNNTASSAFTKAEYGKLKDVWGARYQKLGAESMVHFDQCNVCLHTAQSPVVCTQGHLFCKECILTALLEQRGEMAKVQRTLDRLEAEYEQERTAARQAAMKRIQRNFEDAQMGAVRRETERRSQSPPARRSHVDGGEEGQRQRRERLSRSPEASTSRSSLVDLPARIAAQTEKAIEEAMVKLAHEHALAKRQKLPAYWLPSLTPSATMTTEDAVRQTNEALAKGLSTTRCFVRDQHGHAVSMKSLVDIHFHMDPAVSSKDERRPICPSCKKHLNDVTTLFALRRCGHVHCANCVDTLLRPAIKRAEQDKAQRASCLECSAPIKTAEKDLVRLHRDGTGFSSAGNNEARGKGIAFQG